jgi:hypothetical protein
MGGDHGISAAMRNRRQLAIVLALGASVVVVQVIGAALSVPLARVRCTSSASWVWRRR